MTETAITIKSPTPAARGSLLPHLAIIAVVWTVWAVLMEHGDRWQLFPEYWFMSATMALGSFIAGATSEGGGAVAFPIMTLGFGMEPYVARDFSLMIQSVGMVAAALVIVYMRTVVEWRAILCAGLGGALGVIAGLEWIAPLLSASLTKVFFVSFWLGFGAALYWINRDRAREVLARIESFGPSSAALLFAVGIIGGMVSALTGSGLDIVTFAVLVLVFSLNEKVATFTSIILMATNTVVGFAWRETAGGGVAADAWNYWWVCVPVVVVGAPFGARFIRDRSRHFVVGILYCSIIAQYIWALVVIPQTPDLLLFNMLVVASASLFFWALRRYGNRRASQGL
jgi:uncharacterized membrane protein YfcA